MLKELAQDYLLDFDYSVFDKQIKHFVNDIDILRIYKSKNAKDILGWKFRSSESAIIDAATQIKKLL